MKKIAITGLIVLLVMFVMTCDAGFPEDDEIVEYTDVLYSEDGSEITLYLDGEGVPITRGQQRAMTRRLAMMAYDYLEVVFVEGTDHVARAAWELGQSAGISGVFRGALNNGVYAGYDYDDIEKACIFVGRKDGKTLLGVGKLISVNGVAGVHVDGDTKSVVFGVAAIETGLIIDGEDAGYETDKVTLLDAAVDSFHYTGTVTEPAGYIGPVDINDFKAISGDNSSRFPLGSSAYPMYSLPEIVGATVSAEYVFELHTGDYDSSDFLPGIKHINDSLIGPEPAVLPRIPRYMDGGRYLTPKANLDTETLVDLDGYAPDTGDDFDPVVPLKFTVKAKGGVFSFNIQIPVYNVTQAEATNSGPEAERWWVRSGFGSEFYSLDNGKSSGGCVLMGVGVSALDWIDIEWEFIK